MPKKVISKAKTKEELKAALQMILYDYHCSNYQLTLIDETVERILNKLSKNLIYPKC